MKYPIYSSKTVYPQDIECVWQPKNGKGGIYVGNLQASQNLATLKKHGIKAVLTAAKDIHLRHPKSQVPHHLHIPGEDHERFDLRRYFEKSIDFIDNSLKQTNILVHCMAGISRSVTLVLAYLMKHHRMSYQEAFQAVKRKRNIINPNRGFIRQLQQYQRTLDTQAKAMRRSLDTFQARPYQYSIKKTHREEPEARQALHHSTRRFNQTAYEQQIKRFSTINPNEQNTENLRYSVNAKYQIPRKTQNNQGSTFSSYNDLNKQLDQKIANIRKKYMEATDLLNKQDRKSALKSQARGYFNNLDHTNPTMSYKEESFTFPEPPSLQKSISTNDQFRNSRTASFSNYLNPRKAQSYMYYNYNY